ncbi:unnamed protein product [Adineta steineri]|uniref:Uncharacterized protein n=1 Tax=Adineta steineri TaxID=433720 RepID=A0A814SB70_9BILA|nr:unnamed protein product [Adineta steineri]CAF1145689.1 unnamed protein product [Adineta steineri]CAF3584981.1 unnamed protein product [Adineta steineri]CAF3586702.1 unnamed protein product [Adineta steineri]
MCAKKFNAYFDPSSFFFGQSRKRGLPKVPVDEEVNEESGYYSSSYGSGSESSDAPLRFIIIRHGERVDVMFGAGWTQKAFDHTGAYHCFDANMPPSLPHRTNWVDYDVDTPLTAKGLSQSWNVGSVLARYNLPVTACYSSPAFRSIQTADRILEGMSRKGHVPLRLELGLFECTSWYARSPINFMSDEELLNGNYNIDTHYRSQVSDLRLLENEYQYYDRSKEAMKKIIKLHRKTGGTILLVAHAPSLEVLTRHLMNGQPRPERLAELAGKVDFCSMTVVERESSTKPWQFRYSLDEQANQGIWQQQQLQLQQANHALIPSKSHTPAVQSSSSSSHYQPPNTFANFLAKPSNSAHQHQYFPQQDAYPPYFVL